MILDSLVARYRAWRRYRDAISALSALDQRELDDFDIGRWQIEELARRSR